MTLFWIAAALLLAGALLCVLPPLLSRHARQVAATPSESNLSIHRDQLRELDAERAAGTLDEKQYLSARNELEGHVIADAGVPDSSAATVSADGRWVAAAMTLLIPAASIALYVALGSPISINPPVVVAAETAEGQPHAITPEMIQTMVQRLEQKLQENPENPEGWMMLARSYTALGQYPEAAVAYANAASLEPGNAQLLADYADALAMANGRTLQGEPEDIIKKALQADPKNLKALALAGSVAFERRDYAGAISHWQKILELVPPDSQAANSVNASLQEARALSGEQPAAAQGAVTAAAGGGSVSGTVSGTVQLDPSLKGRVSDTDTVFIFARFADGRRGPPLAITRKTVKDLPLNFTLDDSMAMMPAFNLTSAGEVVVGARVSKSGNASPQPGDLEGFSAPAKVGATNLQISVASVVR